MPVKIKFIYLQNDNKITIISVILPFTLWLDIEKIFPVYDYAMMDSFCDKRIIKQHKGKDVQYAING